MTETDPPVFCGWPAEATAFLAELAADNTRTFWTENAKRYRAALLEPTRALAVALTPEFGTPEFGPPRVFRPYVDRRFRPNADPYRTDAGITAAGPGGTPYVAVLSAQGLVVQVGYQVFDTGQLRRYREAVSGPAGEALEEVLTALGRDDLVPDGVLALARRPRGCPADHPRLRLLRWRGLHVDRAWSAGEWLGTQEPLRRIAVAWRAARPLADWLAAHVGPREPIGAPRRPPDVSPDDGCAAAERVPEIRSATERPGDPQVE
jgi:uncharacterized protein (DUF2461 family)